MAATESDQPISIEQFRRYAAGEMSHAEQHMLEKRILDDPLVAEAYEGFLAMNSTDGQRISADLKNALSEKLNRPKRKVLPLWTYAAAASIFIGIGAYWLVFSSEKEQFSQPESVAIAKSEQPKIGPSDEVSTDIQTKPAPSSAAVPDKIVDTRPELNQIAAAPAKKSAENDFKQNALADELEESVAVAEPIKTEDANVAAAPAQPAAESAPPAAAPASAQAFSARKMVARNREETIEKSKSDSAAILSADQSEPKPGLLPTPSVGWKAYQTYLDQSTSSDRQGNVTVSFTVNPNGSLSNFSGEGDEKLQKQAIDILKKGPVWKPLLRKGEPVSAPAKLHLQFRTTN